MTLQVAGPLGAVLETHGTTIALANGDRLTGANSLIMLNHVGLIGGDGMLDEKAGRLLLRWASDHALGQTASLVQAVLRRRAHAVGILRDQGHTVVRLIARPEWRLAVGLGNRANPHEIGFSLHGTYGWPIIPGSSLKGLAASWAVASGADPTLVGRIFGAPRIVVHDAAFASPATTETAHDTAAEDADTEHARAARGTVTFLDAIPADGPVTVAVDVLTPHVKRYYETTAPGSGQTPVPPAEYHNPVPVNFLTVSGAFAIDLAGRDKRHVNQAADWLTAAGDRFGAGAKTAAGYGYLAITRPSARQDAR